MMNLQQAEQEKRARVIMTGELVSGSLLMFFSDYLKSVVFLKLRGEKDG